MKKSIIILALVLSLLPLLAVYHKIGEFAPLWPTQITCADSIAYIASPSGLYIMDVSNPLNPIQLGFYACDARSVAVEDSIAYVAAGDAGSLIIDISDPQNPTLLGSFNYYAEARYTTVRHNIAYVLAWVPVDPIFLSYGALQIFDVSNPLTPIWLSEYGGGTAYASSITVVDSVAYLPSSEYGLRVYDVSDPHNPYYYYTYPCEARDLSVFAGIAFVATDNGFIYLDLTNPLSPLPIGNYDTAFDVQTISVEGGIAFLGGNGFQIVDVSNLNNPFEIGTYDIPDGSLCVPVTSSIAYAFDRRWQIIDISDQQNSSLSGCCDPPGSGNANSVAVSGNLAWVADGETGLQIINVSNPQYPLPFGSYDTPGVATSVKISNNKAYVADGSSGLQIIDITTPSNPVLLGSFAATGNSFDVQVDGGYGVAFLANTYSGVNIINVVYPQNPFLLHNIGTPLSAFTITLEGCFLYIADEIGLRIYNVIDFAYPYLLGSIETLGNPLQISVSGNTAYLAEGGSGLQIIDVSNPALPVMTGTILPHSSSSISRCYTHDNLLFVSDAYWNEISVYNISNPDTCFQ